MRKYNKFVNEQELKVFLVAAKLNTYASGDSQRVVKHENGGTELIYSNANLYYRDLYYGGEPFSGDEMVFQDNKPIWRMNFIGRINPANVELLDDIYNFLQIAIRHMDKTLPFRGPVFYIENEFCYESKVLGDYTFFSGEEIIKYKENPIYNCYFNGGLIDLLQ